MCNGITASLKSPQLTLSSSRGQSASFKVLNSLSPPPEVSRHRSKSSTRSLLLLQRSVSNVQSPQLTLSSSRGQSALFKVLNSLSPPPEVCRHCSKSSTHSLLLQRSVGIVQSPQLTLSSSRGQSASFKVLHSLSPPPPEVSRQCSKSSTHSLLLQRSVGIVQSPQLTFSSSKSQSAMFKVLNSLSPPPEVCRHCSKSSTHSLLLLQRSVGIVQSPPLALSSSSRGQSALFKVLNSLSPPPAEVSRHCSKSSTHSLLLQKSVGNVQSPPLTLSSSCRGQSALFKVLHSLSPPPEVSRQCSKSSTHSLLLLQRSVGIVQSPQLSPPPSEVSRHCSKSSTHFLLLQKSVGNVQSPPLALSSSCRGQSALFKVLHSLAPPPAEVSRHCSKSSTHSLLLQRSVDNVQSPPLALSSSRGQSALFKVLHSLSQSAVFKAIFLFINNCLTGTKVTTPTRFFFKMNIKIVQQQFSSAHSGIIHIPPYSNQFMVS